MSHEFVTQPELLINNLSFSHIREIMVIDDAFERFFMKRNASNATGVFENYADR